MCICYGHAKACPLNTVTKVKCLTSYLCPLNHNNKVMELLHSVQQEQRPPSGTSFTATALYQTFCVCVCVCLSAGGLRWLSEALSLVSLQTVECLIPDTWSFALTHTQSCVLYIPGGWTRETNSDVTLVSSPSVMMSLTLSDVRD